ncbi:MAG: OmpH family outer membrane protein, partial [bacterium]|nr:OmpH family outer membrane protein [bacterium]
ARMGEINQRLESMKEGLVRKWRVDKRRELETMIAENIGKAKGFTLILDMTSSGIAYFDQAIDITADVIKAVDAKFPN